MKNKLFKIFTVMLLSLTLFGCSWSAEKTAIVTANTTHEIAIIEKQMIEDYCVPRYKAVKTDDDLKKVDSVCLAARASYFSVKTAWSALITVIEAVKAKQQPEVAMEIAAQGVVEAMANLKQVVKSLK